MKKLGMCLMVLCSVLLCGYNEETKQGCTHHHNNECGYENNQCVHTSHMTPAIEPRVERGGEM